MRLKLKVGDKVWYRYNRFVWHKATVIRVGGRFLWPYHTLSLHAPEVKHSIVFAERKEMHKCQE